MLRSRSRSLKIGVALALAGVAGMGTAQIGGQRGAAPVDSSSSFEVNGINVDVSAKDADSARLAGWKIAQRKGWTMLSQRLSGQGSQLPDGALDSIVTGIVVENEQIGPTRYIAKLGVLFDRSKAAGILGVAGSLSRSPPMLVIPVIWSGGAGRVFERTTPWQQAWARYRTGNSTIDYVRPIGTGPDPLMLNVGQIGRRGRGWWRTILDQYGAADVLVPEVKLTRAWPGGPITGVFTAYHGPDMQRVAQFTLRVNNGDALDALMDAGVQRLDAAYQQALNSGILQTDRLLSYTPPPPEATEEEEEQGLEEQLQPGDTEAAVPVAGAVYSIQVDTPNAGAVNQSEALLRGVPGVRSASTTSLALGGISIMRVAYDGDLPGLRAALEARGWSVQEGDGTLRIRRVSLPAAPAPVAPQPSQPAPAPGQ